MGTSTAMVKTYKGVVDAAGNAVMEQVDVDGNGSVGSEDSIGDVNGDDEVNAADARAANVDRNGDRRVTEADLYTYKQKLETRQTEEAQRTSSVTVNTYAIILGQAQVVKSVTTSDALNANGNRYGATEHGYNHSVTTVIYSFNSKGQLTDAKGWTVGTSMAKVKTQSEQETGTGRNKKPVMARQDLNGDGTTEGREDYAVTDLNGDNRITAADAIRANVDQNKDGEVNWKDLYSYSPVMGAMREEAQTTVSLTVNTYKVILGQAQVVKSVTTSDALNKDGRKIRSTEHGYNHSVTTVRYQFNAKGQLTGATGRTVGTSTAMVKSIDLNSNGTIRGDTDKDGHRDVAEDTIVRDGKLTNEDKNKNGVLDRGEDINRNGKLDTEDKDGDGMLDKVAEVWTYHDELQTTTSTTVNTYAIIMGQAQVVKSVTTSDAVNANKHKIRANEHGYSHNVTTVLYRFNSKGQLTGATGWSVGRQAVMVKTIKLDNDGTIHGDTDNDGHRDVAEDTNKDRRLTTEDTNGNGKLDSEDKNKNGRLDRGEDANNNGRLDFGEDTDKDGKLDTEDKDGDRRLDVADEVWTYENQLQTTTSTTVNTYAIIRGQAQVVKSVTTSDAVNADGNIIAGGAHGFSHNVTIVNYAYNAKGQLTGATGWTNGRQTQEVKTPQEEANGRIQGDSDNDRYLDYETFTNKLGTDGFDTGDADKDNEVDRETWSYAWVDQTSVSRTVNTYAIILGQAQVVKSVTTSDAVNKNGARIGVGQHGYNHTVTTVLYQFNARGQLTGASGWATGTSTQKVVTSREVKIGTDSNGKDILAYRAVGDTDKDNVEDAGESWGREVQTTESFTVNTYVIIRGQAQVVKSVTTSDAMRGGVKIAVGIHGYSHSVTTMLYRYNERGQLKGASGWTVARQTQEVKTPKWVNGQIAGDRRIEGELGVLEYETFTGIKGKDGLDTGDTNKDGNQDREVWQYEWVDQTTESVTKNTYVIIQGRAQIASSVTESWAMQGGARIAAGQHGYVYSRTTVAYRYNNQGQLVGATGLSRVWGMQTVRSAKLDSSGNVVGDTDDDGELDYETFTGIKGRDGYDTGDTDKDKERDRETWQYEWVDQPSLSVTVNTYAIINGQAQVVKSVTTNDALNANGVRITSGHHGYNHNVTTVLYRFNAAGQLTGARGWTVGTHSVTVKAVNQNSDGTITGDVNFDGNRDVAEDKNNNGRLDTEDKNRNGKLDVSEDKNRNGRLDEGEDTNKNGTLDLAEDKNGNGKLDTEDADGDGRLDTRAETWGYHNELETTESLTKNTYAIIKGQAQVVKSVTEMWALKDGARIQEGAHGYSYSKSTINYTFNARGQLTGAKGVTRSTNDSQVYNSGTPTLTVKRMTSRIAMTYVIIKGQAVVINQVTDSYEGEQSKEGSHTRLTVINRYNSNGQLIGATGSGYTKVWTQVPTDRDGDGRNITYSLKTVVQRMTQTYAVLNGVAVMTAQVTSSTVTNKDGSKDTTVTPLTYRYNKLGQLIGVRENTQHVDAATGRNGAWTYSVSSKDKDGKVSTTLTTNQQTYVIIKGQAVLMQNVATSNTTGPKRGETNRTVVVTTYKVDKEGRVKGVSANGRQTGTSADEDGNNITPYSGNIGQTYIVHEGQAVMTQSVATNIPQEQCDDGYCSVSESSAVTVYTFDADMKVIGGTVTNTIRHKERYTNANAGTSVESSASDSEFLLDNNGIERAVTSTETTSRRNSGVDIYTSTLGVFYGQVKTLSTKMVRDSTHINRVVTRTQQLNDGGNRLTQTVTSGSEVIYDDTNSKGEVTSSQTETFFYDSNGVVASRVDSNGKRIWSTKTADPAVKNESGSKIVVVSADGKTNYTIDNGELQNGAKFDGVKISDAGVANLNAVARGLGGFLSFVAYDAQTKKIGFGIRFFRDNQTLGEAIQNKGEDDHGSDTVGSVSLSLAASGLDSPEGLNVDFRHSGISLNARKDDLVKALRDAGARGNLATLVNTLVATAAVNGRAAVITALKNVGITNTNTQSALAGRFFCWPPGFDR
ncbi:MAG: hypothetical protein IPN19_02050 [Elusimicrobia bacterium]|nr:hypothetical protein [Elusimicrobiota bacterium]